MRISAHLVVAVFLVGCVTHAPLTEVLVRDAEFREVKKLTPTEIAEFERLWATKQVVDESLNDVGGQHCMLDTARARWLYQTTGYVQLLSKQQTPVYKLPDPQAFNKLIGAEEPNEPRKE